MKSKCRHKRLESMCQPVRLGSDLLSTLYCRSLRAIKDKHGRHRELQQACKAKIEHAKLGVLACLSTKFPTVEDCLCLTYPDAVLTSEHRVVIREMGST